LHYQKNRIAVVIVCWAVALLGAFTPALAHSPGHTFRDCSQCPEMIVVPSGSFMMGAHEGEHDWALSHGGLIERLVDEKPRHRVSFERPFSIGKNEVTKSQYADFVRVTGYATGNCHAGGTGKWNPAPKKNWRNPGFDQTPDSPVVCVSWDDAKAYTRWLSDRTGKEYRLPTEAEWEYAARAGTKSMRYWGNDKDNSEGCAYANVADQFLKKINPGARFFSCRDGFGFTAPVGSFKPNAFGLHDILGNVSELTEDCHNDSYRGAPSNGEAWTAGDCSLRIARGGNWSVDSRLIRIADRSRDATGLRFNFNGFRVARPLSGN